jgi:hypothetical protein
MVRFYDSMRPTCTPANVVRLSRRKIEPHHLVCRVRRGAADSGNRALGRIRRVVCGFGR